MEEREREREREEEEEEEEELSDSISSFRLIPRSVFLPLHALAMERSLN